MSLVEHDPYPWASQVRRFAVRLPNFSGLEGRCIAPDPGDKKHAPRPPMVEVLTTPAGNPIVTSDPVQVRSLIAVLEEAAVWLEQAEDVGVPTLFDAPAARPVVPVAGSEEVA